MIEKLEIQKICYDKTTYNNIELDIKWLERNDFNKISVKHESSYTSPIKELIITKNDDEEINELIEIRKRTKQLAYKLKNKLNSK